MCVTPISTPKIGFTPSQPLTLKYPLEGAGAWVRREWRNRLRKAWASGRCKSMRVLTKLTSSQNNVHVKDTGTIGAIWEAYFGWWIRCKWRNHLAEKANEENWRIKLHYCCVSSTFSGNNKMEGGWYRKIFISFTNFCSSDVYWIGIGGNRQNEDRGVNVKLGLVEYLRAGKTGLVTVLFGFHDGDSGGNSVKNRLDFFI